MPNKRISHSELCITPKRSFLRPLPLPSAHAAFTMSPACARMRADSPGTHARGQKIIGKRKFMHAWPWIWPARHVRLCMHTPIRSQISPEHTHGWKIFGKYGDACCVALMPDAWLVFAKVLDWKNGEISNLFVWIRWPYGLQCRLHRWAPVGAEPLGKPYNKNEYAKKNWNRCGQWPIKCFNFRWGHQIEFQPRTCNYFTTNPQIVNTQKSKTHHLFWWRVGSLGANNLVINTRLGIDLLD